MNNINFTTKLCSALLATTTSCTSTRNPTYSIRTTGMRCLVTTCLVFMLLLTQTSRVLAFDSHTEVTSIQSCVHQIAEYYDIPACLLDAIIKVESNYNTRAINHNANTKDYGAMQINSWWEPKLNAVGIKLEDLIEKPCLNVRVGATILNDNFKRFGKNWYSVGAYNAGTADTPKQHQRRVEYVKKVQSKLDCPA